MRIAALKLVLNVIGILAVFVLGAGQAAAGPVGCPSPVSDTFHLRFSGGNFVLDPNGPGPGPANFVDSPVLSRAGGNPWTPIVVDGWEGYIGAGNSNCVLGFSDLHVWLGLRNSDDQGTNFDLKADVYLNDILVATTQQLCIKSLTRNPALAQEIQSHLNQIQTFGFDGEVILILSARIGTPRNTCGGHASATGLRVYYDSPDRDSRFGMSLGGPSCVTAPGVLAC